MRESCPYCGRYLVSPNGPANSDILIVGEFPGEEEIQIGLPFVGKTGEVLRYELAVAGITIERTRLTNVWLHSELSNKASTYSMCFNHGMSAMMEELKSPRKGVLFLGSAIPPLFGLPPVTSISGILFDGIPMLGYSYMCMFMPNPAIVFHSSVGEVRHGLEVFSKALKGIEVYPHV